jgi:Na+-transporting methylmalonyl-CoA/oxaloacetate decarboxylase beta subunit
MKKLIIFISSLILVLCLGSCSNESSSVGIIGGADGPTATLVTSQILRLSVCKLILVIILAILIAVIIYFKKKKK